MYSKHSFDNSQANPRGDRCKSAFRSRLGEALSEGFQGVPWGRGFRRSAHKAVNILERDEEYVLSLYAAGLKKELFSLSIKNDMLTIRYEPGSPSEQVKFVHEEYQPVGFQRSFLLNGNVETDGISASYTDGVLNVSLPKSASAKESGLTIRVD
jgi:HSP20 family protein